jgi:hypothetical protein
MPNAFFTSADNRWFEPTAHTRGPWDIHACHAGPPTGLLARAVELTAPDKRLVRLTVDLIRPIPFNGFYVNAELTRSGKTVSTCSAQITDTDGIIMANASALLMTEQPTNSFDSYNKKLGSIDKSTEGDFPIQTLHDEPAFSGNGVEIKYVEGQSKQPGPTALWMRTVPLLETEEPSPFQRICPLADCGNAFGRNAEPSEVSFVNADLTIVLNRDPVGQWLGSDSVGYWESNGHGMADALLFDAHGVVGRALQTLLLRKT